MGEHTNTALLRTGYEALAQGDVEAVLAMFSADCVMHIGGDGPLSGQHKGREAIGRALGGIVEWTGGTVRLDVEEVFADDHNGIVIVHETGTRVSDGLTLDVRESHVFRFCDGAAVEFFDVPADDDREAHDAFFS